jgi:hypothetical protein
LIGIPDKGLELNNLVITANAVSGFDSGEDGTVPLTT